MKFFVPRLAIATLLPQQRALQAKFGGKPWGFPIDQWPTCAECSAPMALLAQLPHAPPALIIGEDAVLHLFQCPVAGCSSYDYLAGCTAGFVLKRQELLEGLTEAPRVEQLRQYAFVGYDDGAVPPPAIHEIPLNGEVWITGWHEHDDGIPETMREAFYKAEQFDALPENIRDLAYKTGWRTKIGSVPLWPAYGVAEHPPTPFEYLMQIDTSLIVGGQMPDAEAMGCDTRINDAGGGGSHVPVSENAKRANAPWFAQRDEGADEFYIQFANFGSDGTAFVFINRTTSPPEIIWSWSR